LNILFVHQNMPAQFKHLAPALAAQGHRVVFLSRRDAPVPRGVKVAVYPEPAPAGEKTHGYVRTFEGAVRYGQQVARALIQLGRQGFVPAVVVGHPGWGEMLFVRDIFPDAAIVTYAEFFYSGVGADIGFDPDDPADLDTICRARARNAHLLLSLEAADLALSPTEWQKSRHPAPFQPRIRTIFDGIDTDVVRPDAAARFALPNGRVLTPADEVVTYVARNLEPYRGYPQFIRSLPAILAARPHAQVVIVGGDEVSYGSAPQGGGSWREAMAAEVPLDEWGDRVHILGKIPYRDYLSLLQVSTVHLYLTIPFVLSWSCVEAMAAGCAIVASDTAPVREFIQDGENGRLFPFFDPAALAAAAIEALADRAACAPLRAAARETVLERYALSRCLPRQIALVQEALDLRR